MFIVNYLLKCFVIARCKKACRESNNKKNIFFHFDVLMYYSLCQIT